MKNTMLKYTLALFANACWHASFAQMMGGLMIPSTPSFESQYPVGSVFCSNPTVIADVTNPTTGRTWMDRNLGASQVATSSTDANAYGDLYQWGRRSDGHQCRNSATTTTLSSVDQPAHGDFILVTWSGNLGPDDWRSPQNVNLWQGVNGINNPCPAGYRIPTDVELSTEVSSWSSGDLLGAFNSQLKLSIAGFRSYTGSLAHVSFAGHYWSSTSQWTNQGIGYYRAQRLYFGDTWGLVGTQSRSVAAAIRCIKELVGATGSLDCGNGTITGSLISGQAANNVTASVPYTGGNGGFYAAQSISSSGVTGLTASIAQGLFANGSGNLIYTISGTPATAGTASFAISTGGQNCTLNLTVGSPASSASCGAPNVHNPSLTYGSMTDQNGNVYKTIVIGTQEWMAENLRARTYRNGVVIPLVTAAATWSGLSTGASCWYNNDSASYACPYGRLYNWYAVASSDNVCPSGWHVPTDAEWTTLITQLGGSSVAGGKMKSTGTQYWLSPNAGATNESGFSGLPGGYRDYIGTFNFIGYYGFWWSSSENDTNNAWYRTLGYVNGIASRTSNGKANGFSVRCLRD